LFSNPRHEQATLQEFFVILRQSKINRVLQTNSRIFLCHTVSAFGFDVADSEATQPGDVYGAMY
jgi:hypothetical protein